MNTEIIGGKYRILNMIARGGMSRVYRVEDIDTGSEWAMKEYLIENEDETGNAVRQNLVAEEAALKKIRSRYIPMIREVVSDNGRHFIVMEIIEGQPLDEVILDRGVRVKQSVEDVRRWTAMICELLTELHTMDPPIIYRDIKPGNLILKPSGDICLIDFGTTKEYINGRQRDETNFGTRGYAAPEQFKTARRYTDPRTDLYAVGATMYELLSAKDPAEISERELRRGIQGVPAGLNFIVRKCLAQDPANRFQSAKQLEIAIRHMDLYDPRFQRRERIKRTVFGILTGLGLAFFILGSVLFLFERGFIDRNYKQCLLDGSVPALVTAIRLEPARPAAYEQLMDRISEDRAVDPQERAALDEALFSVSMRDAPKTQVECLLYSGGRDTVQNLIDELSLLGEDARAESLVKVIEGTVGSK